MNMDMLFDEHRHLKGGAWQTANSSLFPQDMHINENAIMNNLMKT